MLIYKTEGMIISRLIGMVKREDSDTACGREQRLAGESGTGAPVAALPPISSREM